MEREERPAGPNFEGGDDTAPAPAAPIDVREAAAVMGRKAGAARWQFYKKRTVEEQLRAQKHRRRQLKALRPVVEALKKVEAALEEAGIIPFRRLKGITNPEAYIESVWSRKIPKQWEAILQAAMVARDYDLAMRVLTAMTAMTTLNPSKMRQQAGEQIGLPSGMNLEDLDGKTLEKLVGRKLIEHDKTEVVEGEAESEAETCDADPEDEEADDAAL